MKKLELIFCSVVVLLSSCRKDYIQTLVTNKTTVFPSTTEEKRLSAVSKEVADVVEKVYDNPWAFYEVNTAIYSQYYADERVMLKDLLFPDKSPVYRLPTIRNSKVVVGTFKKEFFKILEAGNYPLLQSMLLKKSTNVVASASTLAYGPPSTTPTDSAKEIYSNSSGVAIYFPYSESWNFASFPSTYFNIVNKYSQYRATIVPTDRTSDLGAGREPYTGPCGTLNICYKNVVVDDNYADIIFPTHIMAVGAEPYAPIADNPTPPTAGINRVYQGWGTLHKQLDKFIAFANGGGSEIKIARISGYLTVTNQQVTTFDGDLITAQFKRREIRKKANKRIMAVWDENWVPANTEQTYAVWEDDTQGTKTFSGSLGTTGTSTSGGTVPANISFSVVVSTQDEIVTQKKFSRAGFFLDAKNSQGWSFQPDADDYLPPGQDWPWYDTKPGVSDGAIWGMTLPYKTY